MFVDAAGSPVHILLVEDSPTDVMMTREALEYYKVLNPLHVVEDGVAAMEYLRHEGAHRPGLILLDLNLPRKNGQEVLQEIKTDPELMTIPVIILSTSKSEEDVAKAYRHHVNCYIAKPVDFVKFVDVMRTINEFWFGVVTLPPVKT